MPLAPAARPSGVVAAGEPVEAEVVDAAALPPGTHEVEPDGSWRAGVVPDSTWARRQAAAVAPVPQVRGLSGRRATIATELARIARDEGTVEAELAEVVELRSQTLLSWRRPAHGGEAEVPQVVGG